MNSKPPTPLPPLPKHDCNQETPHILVAKLQNNCLYLGGSFGYASDTSSRDHEFKSSVGPHTGCGTCFKTKQNKTKQLPPWVVFTTSSCFDGGSAFPPT